MAHPSKLAGRKVVELRNDYEGFIEKFKPKKTTDDCYTPPELYDVLVDYIDNNVTPLTGRRIVRPFWPGGDYQKAEYLPGDIVIDNPPFSILAKIVDYYIERGIDFWLFAPALTCGGYINRQGVTAVVTNTPVVFENGAEISISFITNLYKDGTVCHVDGRLSKALELTTKLEPEKKPKRRVWPEVVTSAARLGKLANRGISFKISAKDCRFVRHVGGVDVYGGALLLSEKAAAEKAAAEKAAAEKAAAEKAAATRVYLTDDDLKILDELNNRN